MTPQHRLIFKTLISVTLLQQIWPVYADNKTPHSQIKIEAKGNSQPIVATDNAKVTINNGITLEQYEAGLLRQETRLREEYRNNESSPEKLKFLRIELMAVGGKLLNIQNSYRQTLLRLDAADKALVKLAGELPAAQVKKARKLLAENQTLAAKQAFIDIIEKGSSSIALAAYEVGKLEEEDINYSKAMKQYRTAAALEEDNLLYLSAAGVMARTLGKYTAALNWLQSLVRIREALGNESLKLALAKDELGRLYFKMAKYTEALPLYTHSLSIKKSLIGKKHPAYAVTLHHLAELYYAQGKYAKAEPLYQDSLSINEVSLGEAHPSFADVLNNLAELYRIQGKYAKAEPLYKRSLSIYEESLGKDHPFFADALNNLAELYRIRGKYAEAVPLYQQALSIYEKALGKKHPSSATTLNNLAALYHAQGEYEKAKPLYQRSLRLKDGHYLATLL